MSPESAIIEKPEDVEFFNVDQPWLRVLVSRDGNPGVNPLLAADKFATFQAGLFRTADPEIIQALQTEAYRKKGVRCKDNPEDLAEYGSKDEQATYMELEIERRVQARLEEERAAAAHAEASPFQVSESEAAASVVPSDEE